MQFILITPPVDHPTEVEQIIYFFEQGLKRLHVRKPEASKEEMKDYLAQIPLEFLDRIVIHQHFDLSLEFPIRGIHLKEKDWRNSERKLDSYSVCSAAFHRIEDVLNSNLVLEYGFISPVFDSISKTDYQAAFSEDSLIKLNRKSPFSMMALGGVKPNRLVKLHTLGFSGFAVLGAIWQADDPFQAFADFNLHRS